LGERPPIYAAFITAVQPLPVKFVDTACATDDSDDADVPKRAESPEEPADVTKSTPISLARPVREMCTCGRKGRR